ncbi:hypothetical protein CEXT_555301, partial [Caerostris extrusa]
MDTTFSTGTLDWADTSKTDLIFEVFAILFNYRAMRICRKKTCLYAVIVLFPFKLKSLLKMRMLLNRAFDLK